MELPLFPLNSVLFPGMPLRLHIFEERYQIMINECIDQKTPFGVVLIAEGAEALGPLAQPNKIGTTAYIAEVQRLPFGRMNISTIGKDRFRINNFYMHPDKGYMVGDVEIIPMDEHDTSQLQREARRLRAFFERYLDARQRAGQLQFKRDQIPVDYRALAFLSAYVLETETADKQLLLELDSAAELLEILIQIYRREAMLMEILLAPPDEVNAAETPFSLN